jgi:undecaprenyl-diphosphatase
MSLFYAALLGVVQGLTEFLPVSSSAHLILCRAFFGIDVDQFGMIFDVALHLGTLAAVVIYFWNDLLRMLYALPKLFTNDPTARLMRLIVIGSIPAVIIGGLFADKIEETLRTPMATVLTLVIGSIAFLVVEHMGESTRTRGERDLNVVDAVVIGTAQATALAPGISRSGATITAGMLMGVRRLDAARFSFLLGIPAILGAAAKEGLKLRHMGMTAEMGQLFLVGIASSAIVGYLTVRYLLKFLATHRLDLFAYYRLALALVVWIAFH